MAKGNDEFTLLIEAALDKAASEGNINADIKAIKQALGKLEIDATLSDQAKNQIVSEIEKAIGKSLNLGNININTSTLNQAGQQIGNAIGKGAATGLNNQLQNTVNKASQQASKSTANATKQASQQAQQAIKLVESLKESLSGISDGKIDLGMNPAVVDQAINEIEKWAVSLDKLQSITHSYNKEKDTITLTASMYDDVGNVVKVMRDYDLVKKKFARNITTVSTAQEKAAQSAAKQKTAIANLTNQIKQLNSSATDQNSSRPIKDANNLNNLSKLYNDINAEIAKMAQLSGDAFVDQQNKVKGLITDFKSLVSQYKNAENVATKMKGTDFTSGLDIAKQNLAKFEADSKDFSSQISNTLKNLNTSLGNVADAAGLNKFNDELRVARAELEKLKAEANATNRMSKVDIKKSGLLSTFENLERISPEIKNFVTQVNGESVSLDKLKTDLNDIKTAGNLDVLTTKWQSFKKAAEASGIAVNELLKSLDKSNQASSDQDKYYTKLMENINKLYSLKMKLLKADEQETAEINRQIKQQQSQIAYNQSQISSRGLSDDDLTRQVNNLETKKIRELEIAFAKVRDSMVTGLQKMKSEWESQGLLVGEFKTKVEALEQSLATIDSKSSLEGVKADLTQLKTLAESMTTYNKIGLLSNGSGVGNYSNLVTQIEGQFRKLGLSEDEIRQKTETLRQTLNELQAETKKPYGDGDMDRIIALNNQFQQELDQSKGAIEQVKASMQGFATAQQRLAKANVIESWNAGNTRATKEVIESNKQYISTLRDLDTQMTSLEFNRITNGFQENANSMKMVNRVGKSLKDQFLQIKDSILTMVSASTAVMAVMNQIGESFQELKEVDTYLTEISKANDALTKSQLVDIGNNAFDVASKYGKSAANYLSAVQETSRAGYTNAEEIAELSVAAQGAGDMTQDVANQMIIATDKAYKMGGSMESLTAVLDGVNKINITVLPWWKHMASYLALIKERTRDGQP